MARITFKRGDEYIAKLSALEMSAQRDVCGAAVYAGAEMVADAIRSALDEVPTDIAYGTQEQPSAGPKPLQLAALKSSLGISHAQTDGGGLYNVKIGWAWYNSIVSKRWPRGQPNQMVARSVERGTSFMRANPFVKPTMARIRKAALERMKSVAEEKIEEIMK